MRNENPCRNCQRRRRKCVWEENDPQCERCAQVGAKCIPSQERSTAPSIRDGNEQLAAWWDQTLALEDTLNSTAMFLRYASNSSTAATLPSIIPQALSVTPSSVTAKATSSSMADETHETSEEPQWTLSVINGRVRLESKIKDFHELMMYHQASIRYLSPLAGLLQRESVRFEGMSASVAFASTGMIVRCTPQKGRQITIRQLPYPIDYQREMDQLIQLYMQRYNVIIGVIHEPTFMDHYRKLSDPLNSAIALGICIDAIAYFYPQLKYPPLEKRQLAEFFYGRCRDLLIDSYEDPDRRLEAVITTTLLTQYLSDVVMEYYEVRRLVTVALLICADLEANETQRMSRVELAMLRRHHMYCRIYASYIDLFLEGKFDLSGIQDTSLDLLDGETYTVAHYYSMWEHVLKLCGSSYITSVMQQIVLAVHGHPYELSLDMILQFVPTIRNWWESLPDDLRICDDPFTLTVDQVVDNVTSSTALLPFAVLHALTALIQSSMLKPRVANAEDGATDDVLRIIREKAVSLTLSSIRALVYIVKRNLEIDIEAIPLSIGYMLGTLHAVCSVVNNSLDVQLPFEILDLLLRCFSQINALFPQEHMIPPSSSILESFITSFRTEPFKINPMDIYEKFPMPGYAMTSDILFTCFRQLERGFQLAL